MYTSGKNLISPHYTKKLHLDQQKILPFITGGIKQNNKDLLLNLKPTLGSGHTETIEPLALDNQKDQKLQ